MAPRKRKSRARPAIIVALLAIAAVALWFAYAHRNRAAPEAERAKVLREVGADKIDPANDGIHVKVSGQLSPSGPVHDAQLGVGANAAILFRDVEIYQWLEHCQADSCRYDTGWSVPVDSNKFRELKGHENPPSPFASAFFLAPGLKLGGYTLDPDLALAQLHATAYAVHGANLPPNLAATFVERDGVLYAGGDPAHPAVGEVRVSYRSVPLETVSLTGVQHGAKLTAN
jgi:hypothetical protein